MPRILVVDDDVSIRRLLEVALDDLGEVVAVESGEDALTSTAAAVPDLAIVDVAMPGIDGLELVRRWRADDATSDLEIVLLSGLTEVDDEQRGYHAGADAYVTKPVEIDVLHALVGAMLAAQRA